MMKSKIPAPGVKTIICFALLLMFCFLSFTDKPDAASKYKFDFFTTHNQFYLADADYKTSTGADNFWTKTAYSSRLAVGPDILGIGIESYGHVKGELSLLTQPSEESNFDKYDHVVEGGITIKSGTVQLLNFPDYKIALKVKIAQGNYRVRIYSLSLANVNINEDEGLDHYKIEIWPGNNAERKVLKQYSK